ncbi:MAG: hypothetical protein VKJ44_09650 [Synechococcus sp.]|nr:hypothetical protein [Synechococcus sp.]
MDLDRPSASPDPGAASTPEPPAPLAAGLAALFREHFDALLPRIQRQWPDLARHTLEAGRGSFDQLVEVISHHSGLAAGTVRRQLSELLQASGDQAGQVAGNLRPLEEQLEALLADLRATLRPRLERPVREKPLLALGIAAGVGLLVGLLLSSGRRSA